MNISRVTVLALAIAVTPFRMIGGTDPITWFAPMDTLTGSVIPSWNPIHGSFDYFSLFDPAARWASAASHVRVFKLYGAGLGQMSDAQLRSLISFTRSHGIQLALEAEMIDFDGTCGGNIEGFGSKNYNLQILNRLAAAGGELSYVAFDESFYGAALNTTPGACRWDTTTVANRIVDMVHAMRTVFPRLQAGDIEPILVQPSASDPDISTHLTRYAQWFDTYRRVAGEPLAFFHADVNWTRTDWYANLSAIRDEAEKRGIPFGIIYNGNYDASSDAEWTSNEEKRLTQYELQSCEPPAQVIFQSWDVYPRATLPETSTSSFTHVIGRYFRKRDHIVPNRTPASIGGVLVDDAGHPLAGKTIAIAERGIDPGIVYDYVVEGTVPAGASQLVVGLRINTECVECTVGSGRATLYSVSYTEGGGPNRVTNADFSGGMKSWGFSGAGQATLRASENGSGNALYVNAPLGAAALLNSTVIQPTPGSHFKATFRARVPAFAANTGGFMLAFSNARLYAYLSAPVITIGTVTTDGSGAFTFTLPATTGSVMYSSHYDGDDQYWPADNCRNRHRASAH